jgi:hypothetical protein
MVSSTGIIVEQVIIGNWDRTSNHTIQVVIEYDGETIYEKTHELKQREGQTAPSATISERLPDDAGKYVVSALMPPQSSPNRVNVGQATDKRCATVEIHAFDGDDLGISVGEHCSSEQK